MVQSRGRGLDPLQAALGDDVVPRDGNLRVTAEYVGVKNLLGDSLLPGIDDLGIRGDVSDSSQMSRLDGVT